MKKDKCFVVVWIISIFTVIFLGGADHHHPFFGVNATVQRLDNQVYYITTSNKAKKHAGVVQAIPSVLSETPYTLTLEIKGKANVYLKIEEFNSNGKYINMHQSKKVTLTKHFKPYRISWVTHPATSQVDFFVLTTNRNGSFSIKSPKLWRVIK